MVIPHQIRAFIRSTGGLVRGEAPKETAQEMTIKQKVNQRKNFDPVARYSTVTDEFQKGMKGLVDDDLLMSAKEIAAAAVEAEKNAEDWGLTYGKKKINP